MITKTDSRKPDIPLPSDSYQALLQLTNGFWVSQMIHVAAKLAIADLIAGAPKSSAELAAITGVHAPSLYRLLRALASVGVFAEDDQGRFNLTPLAEPLCSGVPGSIRDWAIFVGETQEWRSWEQLFYSIKTGETAFPLVWGMQNWEYRAQNPEANHIFNKAMTSAAFRRIGPVIAGYDFSGLKTIVDVGGGHGAFIAAILKFNPAMHGILYDLPHVAAGAAQALQNAKVAERCEIVSGNFLETIPAGGDAYLLSKVIHDWDDDHSITILKNCRQVMDAHSRLLLVEAVIPPGNTPHNGKLSDLNMLVINTGGRERTEAEFRDLLDAAGFKLTRIVPTPGEISVIEGTPV